MNKTAVIYKSKYGSTKQYAAWIARALDAALFDAADIKPAQLMDYDMIIYGGGLYAGSINGIGLVAKNPCKALVVFTVSLSDPKTTDLSGSVVKSFTKGRPQPLKTFHLRGGIDYDRLGTIHKGMMATLNKILSKKKSALTEQEKDILATYGGKFDFVSEDAVVPIVEFVRRQMRT